MSMDLNSCLSLSSIYYNIVDECLLNRFVARHLNYISAGPYIDMLPARTLMCLNR
jgi:hypothetical protein